MRWFLTHKPSDELVDKMIKAVEKQMNTLNWQKDNGKYIPHPYSWLNSESWENEIEEYEIAQTSEKSISFVLARKLLENLTHKKYEETPKNKKILKLWAIVIDEYLAKERTPEREDKVYYAIKKSTNSDYWKSRITDAESLIKNIDSI